MRRNQPSPLTDSLLSCQTERNDSMLPYTFHTDRETIRKYRDNPEYLMDTGLSAAELSEKCDEIEADVKKSLTLRNAEILAFILDNARLEVCPYDLFADRMDHDNIFIKLRSRRRAIYREVSGDVLAETDIGHETAAYTGDDDFGHTTPDWPDILRLGVPGIIARLEDALSHADDASREFFAASLTVWQAFRRLILRFADAEARFAADHPVAAMAEKNFRAIADRAPETLAQALTLIALVYRTQTHVEGINVRSLGRLDVQCAPYLTDDIREMEETLRYFIDRMNDRFVPANIPITLCGEDIAGDKDCLDFVLIFLKIYGELANVSPKLQIRVGDHTPAVIIETVCRLIRSGCNSLLFCNDNVVTAALIRNGHTPEDAMNYVMIGCYEPASMGREISCTTNGRVSLPMAVECALNGGRTMLSDRPVGLECAEDFADFDAFFAEVKRQAAHFAEQSMRRTAAMERLYPSVCTSPFFSGGMADCLASGRDVYAGGLTYNHSSVNIIGIATAADSLAAIRKLVYEDGSHTLAEVR
ncbi:MAG: hypothetical protein E7632_13570, partial [Ruminococcaceae bacterium]|nr:hypothetical protein [Oscillospiraceae bacterium]